MPLNAEQAERMKVLEALREKRKELELAKERLGQAGSSEDFAKESNRVDEIQTEIDTLLGRGQG